MVLLYAHSNTKGKSCESLRSGKPATYQLVLYLLPLELEVIEMVLELAPYLRFGVELLLLLLKQV